MNSYIFLVGRSDSHSESVTAIKKLGYKAGIFVDITVELDNPAQFDIIVPTDFSTAMPAYTLPDGIMIAGLQCTYENYIVAKAKIGTSLSLAAISIESASAATDKLLMRDAFAKNASNFTPQFTEATSLVSVIEFANTYGYPVILKPTNLVKSLLVTKCSNEEELRHNFSYAQEHIAELYEKYGVKDRNPLLIIEEFVIGKSCSIAAFVDQKGNPHFCEGIVALQTAGDRGIDDNYLYARTVPLDVDNSLGQKLFEAARVGIQALGMSSTAAHVELIYTDNGSVYIIEIGARIGGYRPRMYAASYGINLHEQEVQLAAGNIPELTGQFKGPTAVVELFPNTPGEFVEITNETQLRNLPSLTYLAIKAKPGEFVGKAATGYKACAIVMLHNANWQQFKQDLVFLDTNVQVSVT